MVLVCAQVVQCTALVPSGTHAEPANGPWAKKYLKLRLLMMCFDRTGKFNVHIQHGSVTPDFLFWVRMFNASIAAGNKEGLELEHYHNKAQLKLRRLSFESFIPL